MPRGQAITAKKTASSRQNVSKARSALIEFVKKGKQASQEEEELELTSESEEELVIDKRKPQEPQEPQQPEPQPQQPPTPQITKEDLHAIQEQLKALEELKRELQEVKQSNQDLSERYKKALESKARDVNNAIVSAKRSMCRFNY